MTNDNKTTLDQPTEYADAANIDEEVAELLADMITLLCNANDGEVKVKPICGGKSAMFEVDFDSPTSEKYRGMVIGREGRTISAIRQYLKAVGGAYRRYYDVVVHPRKA